MRKYFSFFRIRFAEGLQYRAAALAGVATQFGWGFMNILVFNAFYRSDPQAFPMGFEQLSSYLWLQQAFLALFIMWFFENDIFESIRTGGVAYELCRPLQIYGMWFFRNMALRLSSAALRCMPILCVAFFLPKPYNLSLPADMVSFLLFLLSMFLGLLVVLALSMLIYISVFFTLSPMGVRMLAVSLVELLSGQLIPLNFFPERFRTICELLPFAAMQNVPLRIYSGNINGPEAAVAILLQVFWMAFLLIVGWLFMRTALQRVVVQGG